MALASPKADDSIPRAAGMQPRSKRRTRRPLPSVRRRDSERQWAMKGQHWREGHNPRTPSALQRWHNQYFGHITSNSGCFLVSSSNEAPRKWERTLQRQTQLLDRTDGRPAWQPDSSRSLGSPPVPAPNPEASSRSPSADAADRRRCSPDLVMSPGSVWRVVRTTTGGGNARHTSLVSRSPKRLFASPTTMSRISARAA